jgi:hypothetical protein
MIAWLGTTWAQFKWPKDAPGLMDRNALEPGYKLTHTRRIQLQQPSQSGASVVAGHGSASVTIKYTVVVSGACALLSLDRGVCESHPSATNFLAQVLTRPSVTIESVRYA